jgi:hypothetical protein
VDITRSDYAEEKTWPGLATAKRRPACLRDDRRFQGMVAATEPRLAAAKPADGAGDS